MKFLTSKQRTWLVRKTIKENDFYMFPRFGFYIYSEPNFESGQLIDTNPFFQSLDGEYFLVKKKENGFCKGNFYNNPKGPNFYLHEDELSGRGLLEIIFLLITTFIPMTVYNLVNGGVEKIENLDKIQNQ